MADKKYLDGGGLTHFWDKVKAYLDNRFGTGTYDNKGYFKINASSIDMNSASIDSNSSSLSLKNSTLKADTANLSIYDHNSLNFSTGKFTWSCINSKESAVNTIKIDIDRDFAFFAVPAGTQVNHIKQYFGMGLVYFDASERFHYCQFYNDLDVSVRIYAIKMTGTSAPTFQFLQTVVANDNYKLENQNNELYLVFWCSVKS